MFLRAAVRGVLLTVVASAVVAQAAGTPTPLDLDPLPDYKDAKSRENDGPLSDFRLISYFFSRASFTNQVGDPAGLKGVSLGPIGLGAGSAVSVGSNSIFYVDQRWIPVIEYTPFFFDGIASVRAQFEIDYMWGLAANTTQPNQGGGFNADQVNIQTKNVNVAIYPFKKQKPLSIVIGTQTVYDTILDPATNSLFDLQKSGYKFTYLASDATGLSVYGNMGQHRFKVSLLPLGAAQPDRVSANNPALFFVILGMADYSFSPMPGTHFGLSVWTLRDETKGKAFAYEGLVYSGPSSPGLAAFTGAPRFAIDNAQGGVSYFGFNFQHNLNYAHGPLAASGFVMVNAGHFISTSATTLNPKDLDVLGVGANLEVSYRYGRTMQDVISLEGMFSSGDSNPEDSKYTGVFTMNTYGLPGAVWFNSKTLLLFPFTSTINNYTGAVTDISNQGYGMTAAVLAATRDLIPNTLSLKLGSAAAVSNTTPGDSTGVAEGPRGRFIGVEFNAELKWQIRYLMTVGLHGAYMVKGDFYNNVSRVTANPFAIFTTYTWYGF